MFVFVDESGRLQVLGGEVALRKAPQKGRDALAELRYLDKVLSQRLPGLQDDAAAGSGASPEPACD